MKPIEISPYLTDSELSGITATFQSIETEANSSTVDDVTKNETILMRNLFFSMQIFIAILYAVIVFGGSMGNGIVIWIVLGHKAMRSVTNYFLLNLALADFLNCSLNIPLVVPSILFENTWYFGEFMCM